VKKLLLLFVLVFVLSGCSLIPRLTFDTKGTTPQQTEKSKIKESCKGEVEFGENGQVTYCSKGYTNYAENYEKKERKYTFTEKIKNIITNLSGTIFWIVIALIFLVPGSLGFILLRLGKAFDQTVAAIKKFRGISSAKEELDNYLRAEQDKETKKLIATKRVE